jgi:2-polyprenyl-3-methyl-5-hydroxy-6-metoxy-1,4-benzoquinol methylase
MFTELDCPACGAVTPHTFLFEKSGFKIFKCETCGIGRTDARNFDPGSFYTENYFNGGHSDGYSDYVASEDVLRIEFARSVKLLLRFISKGAKILEVGSAYGFFLLEAEKFFTVEGIEISEDAAKFAHSRGLAVRTGLVNEQVLSEMGKFDAIVLFDVIEHLPDPHETLALCWQHLNPGGVIVFTTGDFGSIPARAGMKNWRLMTPPQHLFFFTRKSVEALAHRLGAVLEKFDHPWKTVPLNLILFQLPRLLGLTARTKISFGKSVGIPVNLFDAMRVIYRKPTLPS